MSRESGDIKPSVHCLPCARLSETTHTRQWLGRRWQNKTKMKVVVVLPSSSLSATYKHDSGDGRWFKPEASRVVLEEVGAWKEIRVACGVFAMKDERDRRPIQFVSNNKFRKWHVGPWSYKCFNNSPYTSYFQQYKFVKWLNSPYFHISWFSSLSIYTFYPFNHISFN